MTNNRLGLEVKLGDTQQGDIVVSNKGFTVSMCHPDPNRLALNIGASWSDSIWSKAKACIVRCDSEYKHERIDHDGSWSTHMVHPSRHSIGVTFGSMLSHEMMCTIVGNYDVITDTIVQLPGAIWDEKYDGITAAECFALYEKAMTGEAASISLTVCQLAIAKTSWSDKLKRLVDSSAEKRRKDNEVRVDPEYWNWE